MKTITLPLAMVLALCSAGAVAQERFGSEAQNQAIAEAQQTDTRGFCVYADEKYSVGALIQVGETLLECRMLPATSELVEPGARWARTTADEA